MKLVVMHLRSGRSLPCGACVSMLLLSVLWLLMPRASSAGAELSAVYTQGQGTNLALEIQVGASPPSSLILIQNLPPGVAILKAQPPPNNVNAGKGEAKWLLRDLAPGRFTIRITLDRPVQAGEISAEIRFKPAQGGGMLTLPVAKP